MTDSTPSLKSLNSSELKNSRFSEEPTARFPRVQDLPRSRSLPGMQFWFQWMILNGLGRLIGRAWYEGIGAMIEGGLGKLLGMLGFGLLIGLAQWWLLRRYLPRAKGWILATVVGGGVGGILSIVTGLAQWLVLKRRLNHAVWWIPATLLAGGLGWAVVVPVTQMVGGSWGDGMGRFAGCLLEASLTGLVMVRLLRQKRVSSR